MTPLKPIENRRVRGVASERYPLNTVCAHPECTEATADPHHCFPRSQIIGDSWFVEIDLGLDEHQLNKTSDPFPHVAGLCRVHHDDVEEHRAWIRLIDGEFVWYNRDSRPEAFDVDGHTLWTLLAPLNPQPGSREGKPKRKKFKGEKTRARATWSIRVPQDAQEDGIEALKVLVEECRKRLGREEGTPPYYTLSEALYGFLIAEE